MRPEIKAGFVIGLCCLAGGLFWAINGTRNAATTEIPFDVLPPGDDSVNNAFLASDSSFLGGRAGGFASSEPGSTSPDNDDASRETHAVPAAESPKSSLDAGAGSGLPVAEPGAISSEPNSSVADDLGDDLSGDVEYPGGDLSLSNERRPASDEEVLEPRRGGAETSGLTMPGSDVATTTDNSIGQAPAPKRGLGGRVRSLTGTSASASTYEIQDGDNYTSIAREEYGHDKYAQLIQQANPEYDPNRLPIGKPLRLPPKAEFDKQISRKAGAPDKKKIAADAQGRAGRASYVVAEGDTLTKIATNVLKDAKRWPEIYELNRDRLESPDVVPEGIELRMPPLASVKKP